MTGLLKDENDRPTKGDYIKGTLLGLLAGNPLGVLAGPAIKNSRLKREEENKLIRDRMAARDQMADLFGRTSPGPAAYGPGKTVPGILAGPDGVGSEDVQIPGKRYSTEIPTYQTPKGQAEMLGILAQVDPAVAAKGAMPEATRANTMQQRIDALRQEGMRRGLGPDEMNAFIDANLSGGMDPVSQLTMELRQEREARERRTEEREIEDREVEQGERDSARMEYANNLTSSTSHLMDLYELNNTLAADPTMAGALTKPGLPFAEMRREIASVFSPEAAAGVDDFQSLVNQIAIERLSTEGFEGNTNARFSAFTSTKPSFERLGPANSKTILRNLKGALLADKAKGYLMPAEERRRVEAFIERAETEQGIDTLEIGDIVDGYEYMGGPRGDKSSWERR
jgi:hypothetical protein